jgi:hypothetical protein
MKTTTLIALLLLVLTGCAKKQKVVQSTDECIAARDAALRAASSCDRCCTPHMQK